MQFDFDITELKKVSVEVLEHVSNEPVWRENLKLLIHRSSCSISEFSRRVQIPFRTIYNIIHNNTHDIKLSSVKKICNHCHISIDNFTKNIIKEYDQNVSICENNSFKSLIKENLLIVMKEAKLDKNTLAQLSGVSLQAISDIIRKPESDSNISTLAALSDFFYVSIDELIGEMPLSQSRKKGVYKIQSINIEKTQSWPVYIPIIEPKAILKFLSISEPYTVINVKNILCYTSKNITKYCKLFAVQIHNNIPHIKKGSIIIINAEVIDKSPVNIFLSYNARYDFLFFIYKHHDGSFASYINHTYKNDIIQECSIIGAVVNIISNTYSSKL